MLILLVILAPAPPGEDEVGSDLVLQQAQRVEALLQRPYRYDLPLLRGVQNRPGRCILIVCPNQTSKRDTQHVSLAAHRSSRTLWLRCSGHDLPSLSTDLVLHVADAKLLAAWHRSIGPKEGDVANGVPRHVRIAAVVVVAGHGRSRVQRRCGKLREALGRGIRQQLRRRRDVHAIVPDLVRQKMRPLNASLGQVSNQPVDPRRYRGRREHTREEKRDELGCQHGPSSLSLPPLSRSLPFLPTSASWQVQSGSRACSAVVRGKSS
eukprot:scaffold6_cov245-Pinguiococcus_pyrenoidosus.AAC.6